MARAWPRSASRLNATRLEDRITPVLGAFQHAPVVELGTGYDGVVQLSVGDGVGTGSLLWTGRHILTAAHVVTNHLGVPDQPVSVFFDLPNLPRVALLVPASNIHIRDDFNPTTLLNDIAILELPAFAPSQADRYEIYRGSNEVGEIFTIVGYGRVGTGLTGEQLNTENVKHFAANRYDLLGDRLNLGKGQTLIYDFDNAQPANDALGRLFDIHNLGVKDEGNAARGDSGGPTFLGAGGRQTIVGVTSGSLNATRPSNPAVLNRQVETGFGTISLDTRVSFHAPWIDEIVSGKSDLKLDLRTLSYGLDDEPDTVDVQTSEDEESLVISINGERFDWIAYEQIATLTIIGAGERLAPFPTAVRIARDVPAWLAITLERIGEVIDERPVRLVSSRNDTLIPIVSDGAVDGQPPIFVPSPTPDAEPLPLPILFDPPMDKGIPGITDVLPRPIMPIDLQEIPNTVAVQRIVAIGAGAGGGPRVQVIRPETGEVIRDFFPFEPEFSGGVQTAIADINGDLVPDLIVAAGVGGAPRVAIFDGVTGEVIFDEFVFESDLRGGVTVAAADVTGDGRANLIVGAGVGGGPRVRVLELNTGLAVHDFFAFDPAERGGVNLAVGDINNDGTPDLIIGAGVGMEPVVRVLDGRNPSVELRSFAPYSRDYRGGVSVAAGDLTGDNRADLVTAPANGGGPHIRVFGGRDHEELASFFAFDPTSSTGVRVGIADLNGDGLGEIVAGQGPGGNLIRSFSSRGVEISTSLAFEDEFLGGVFIG